VRRSRRVALRASRLAADDPGPDILPDLSVPNGSAYYVGVPMEGPLGREGERPCADPNLVPRRERGTIKGGGFGGSASWVNVPS